MYVKRDIIGEKRVACRTGGLAGRDRNAFVIALCVRVSPFSLCPTNPLVMQAKQIELTNIRFPVMKKSEFVSVVLDCDMLLPF